MRYKRMLEKKSFLNLFTALSYQVLSIGLGLLLPYLFITNLGSEANGLLNSVGQAFTCLGLLEAGVGTATVQALYRPIAAGDQDKICKILSATNHYYHKTGMWYAASVTLLAVFFPFLVDTQIHASTIRLVISLQGLGAILSYFVQAKYSLLLRAEGKNYIITIAMLLILLLRNFGKIVAIRLGYNVVAVQIVQLFTILLEGCFVLVYVKRHYRWLSLKVEPDYDAISQKNAVLAQSIAWTVFNHTDILVLTVFLRDLRWISVYSVYMLLFESAQNLTSAVRDSFQYKIGRIAQQSGEQLDNYFVAYSNIILALTLAVFSTMYLISPMFVILYTDHVTDIDYRIAWVPELFFIFKILYGTRILNKQVIEANGQFRQTQRIAILEAILNIGISIILVNWLGIVGVLIGTVVALVCSVGMYVRYLVNIAPRAIKSQIWLIIVASPVIFSNLFIGANRFLNTASWIQLILIAVAIAVTEILLFGSCLLVTKCISRRVLKQSS